MMTTFSSCPSQGLRSSGDVRKSTHPRHLHGLTYGIPEVYLIKAIFKNVKQLSTDKFKLFSSKLSSLTPRGLPSAPLAW